MTAPTLPEGFPALRDPYEASQLAGLEQLERLAARQAAGALTQTFPAVRPAAPMTAPREGRASRGPAWRTIAAGAFTGVILGTVIGLHAVRLPDGGIAVRLGWYGTAVSALIAVKLLMSLAIAPARDSAAAAAVLSSAQVAVAITLFNEDPPAFGRCLDSLLAQTRLPDAVTVVDDASPDRACMDLALRRAAEFRARGIDFEVTAFPVNKGKRDGLAAGYRRSPRAFAYMCLDSDTILERHALERLLRPFASRDVQAVTGTVLAANRDANLLTRLLDLRYAYSFLGERAAYSVLGSVLCVPGAGGMYRGTAVRRHLDAWLGQRFLGRQCTYGDDRHMTFWCLKEGRVLLAPDAVAWTYVPEKTGHFLRQQVRWSKSFFRESLWMLGRMPPARACWWLTLLETATWAVFTAALLYSLAVHPLLAGQFTPWAYLGSAVLLSYARAGHYAEAEHPQMGWGGRLAGLALAPLYGMIHITLLLPLRLYALATLADNKWGTRGQVEVAAA